MVIFLLVEILQAIFHRVATLITPAAAMRPVAMTRVVMAMIHIIRVGGQELRGRLSQGLRGEIIITLTKLFRDL